MWAFAVLVAIHQIGIASALVTALFVAVVGAVALALGLSFGLGGRETAGAVVRRFYERNHRPGATTLDTSFTERGRVGYAGVEHRHGPGDRRSTGDGRRAIG